MVIHRVGWMARDRCALALVTAVVILLPSVNRVHLLEEHVANQIAAGEVIERPASVVKELVENALDADARQVTVTIKQGGRSLVRVADDGWGMSRDDALLALERHATSKIEQADDLARIRSLGFRGEAIPSIASVSRFTLTTRERGALTGTKIQIDGGTIREVTDEGTPEGTSVEVRNLFYNLPARRKFLRTEPTERTHIEHALTLAALGNPGVGFRFLLDDHEKFNLAPTTDLRERLRELYGADLLAQLVPVDRERDGVTVSGLIGKPGISRSTRSQQHLFVNGRPVDSKGIGYALREGYHTALMRGQFPVTFLFITIDPGLVDVNIHPAKREVRFRDEYGVRQVVIDAVRSALAPSGETPQPIAVHAGALPEAADAALDSFPPLRLRGELALGTPMETPSFAWQHTQPAADDAVVSPVADTDSLHRAPQRLTAGADQEEGAWRVLGVIGQLYVLAESAEGLVLIDQHAAHERVLFEKMLRSLDAAEAPSQKLLLPVTLELETRDAAFLRANLATFQKLGLGVSEFGDNTYLLDAVPPFFPVEQASQAFRQIIDELHQTGEQVHARRLGEDRIATTVCRHAVKARDPLKGPELEGLLKQLHACDLPYTCPHGRPTMIQISYEELEKKFRRVV